MKPRGPGNNLNLTGVPCVSMKRENFMRQTTLVAALAVFSSAAFAADPQLMNMVMPGAKILAGANGASTRVSPFGQFVIAKIASLGGEPQSLLTATGFDPLQDISEVLAATTANPAAPSALFMATGNFNADKIIAAITAKNAQAQVSNQDGAKMVTFTDATAKQSHALAFIGNSIAVAGDLGNVQAALAQNLSPSPMDPTLAAQVNQISSAEDEWVLSTVSLASLIPANAGAPATGPAAQILPILKSVQSFSGGIKFGDNVVLTGQAAASDAQNATALASVIRLAATLASLGAGNNAQISQLGQLLQTLQVTPNGSAVNVSLSIPETQLEAALNQVMKPAAPAVAALQRRK